MKIIAVTCRREAACPLLRPPYASRRVIDEAAGKEILSTVSKELVMEFGRGFSWPNLSRMVAFSEAFPDRQIVATLLRQLGWSLR